MNVRKGCLAVLLLALVLVRPACVLAAAQGPDENQYYIYYLNHNETELERVRYIPNPDVQQEMLQDLHRREIPTLSLCLRRVRGLLQKPWHRNTNHRKEPALYPKTAGSS